MYCNICGRYDCKGKIMKRQVGPSTFIRTCGMEAMKRRALGGQTVANEPPESPGSKWNKNRWYYDK